MLDKLTPLSQGGAEAMGLHYVGQVNGRPVFVCGSLVTIVPPAEFDPEQQRAVVGTAGCREPTAQDAAGHEVAAILQAARDEADQILNDAGRAAGEIRQSAKDEAARIVAESSTASLEANTDACATRHAASLDAAAVRQTAQDEVARVLAEAHKTAQDINDAAERFRQTLTSHGVV
ncbi:MAG: hypothetical protein WCJ64_19980 [Rhodospirillaceae bacterium]